MNFLYYTIGILLCLVSCNCQKLICDSKVINSAATEDLPVNFTILNGDVQIFNPTRKTVFLIYGLPVFGEPWGTELGKKWLKLEPVNVITVGWETPDFSAGQFYIKTALSTELFAFKIKEYIINLFGSHVNIVQFHLVGHSLGAHIAGQTARLLKKDGITVQRVTGLDPAHPCFENETASLRLRKSDAEFVDVIHTNSDQGDNRGNFGSYNLMGHADFYPNGGNRQPECNKNTSQNSADINDGINILIEMDEDMLKNFVGIDPKPFLTNALKKNSICNHNTAYKYFIESLSQNSKKRWASPTKWPLNVTKALLDKNKNCNDKDCIEMGINARMPNDLRTAFYVNTSDD